MNENQLVTALKHQVPAALQELVDTYGDRLLRSAFSLCGDEAEAEDIVQDTFLEAIRSIHRFQGRSTIHTWLHAIMLNLVRRHHRGRKRMVYNDALMDREVSPSEEGPGRSDAEMAAAALAEALRRLSEAHREVIVLHYYEEMKIHEIASQLGLSKGTVKSRLHYAIGDLQKLLPGELNLFGVGDTEEMQKQ
jgi:RNA polymerase sigma-70 factor (ECF subfamily)